MADPLPVLSTPRLVLRPFTQADAPRVQTLASEYEVALNTARIPHPYPKGAAEAWIAENEAEIAAGKCACFAIVEQATGDVIGAIGFCLEPQHRRAELGYWLGSAYWNRGYATEAARAILEWAFRELGLERVHAYHYARNVASGRVLQKIGMQREGLLRRHILKWGEFVDEVVYGILRDEFVK
jgi:RimJ/RimL family protein N-acetyltransferase